MKVNMKGNSTTIRAVKQETKEIKEGVTKIENHMRHYNVGMGTLTNFVKVKSNFRELLLFYGVACFMTIQTFAEKLSRNYFASAIIF